MKMITIPEMKDPVQQLSFRNPEAAVKQKYRNHQHYFCHTPNFIKIQLHPVVPVRERERESKLGLTSARLPECERYHIVNHLIQKPLYLSLLDLHRMLAQSLALMPGNKQKLTIT